MGYLHNDTEQFKAAIDLASVQLHLPQAVVEKDYYVTMVLRELLSRISYAVFKGGTSLSKCHHIIQRFSEDIDITTDTTITQSQMKHLKEAIKETAAVLGLSIPNIEQTRSRRSYNQYMIEYKSIMGHINPGFPTSVLLETSFAEISFPTVILPANSFVGQMMASEAPDRLEEYKLDPFPVKVQSINRTLIDKVFAICDYYITNKIERHSRHIYDIFKLIQVVPMDKDFKLLIPEVRAMRARNSICPSAKPGIDIPKLLNEIIKSDVYRSDYNSLTRPLLFEGEVVPYEVAINPVKTIAESNCF